MTNLTGEQNQHVTFDKDIELDCQRDTMLSRFNTNPDIQFKCSHSDELVKAWWELEGLEKEINDPAEETCGDFIPCSSRCGWERLWKNCNVQLRWMWTHRWRSTTEAKTTLRQVCITEDPKVTRNPAAVCLKSSSLLCSPLIHYIDGIRACTVC